MDRDPAALLTAWEAAAAVPPVARGAVVVQRAGLPGGAGDVLDLPIGEVARIAIRACAAAFGAVLEATVVCGACGEVLELDVAWDELAAGVPGDGGVRATVDAGDRTLQVRAPTTRDLLAVAGRPDAAVVLLERCVAGDVRGLSTDGVDAVDRALERLAGPAGTVVRTTCQACGCVVTAGLDPTRLLWEHVALAAPTLLAEVAALAAAFGWSEDAVLGLSAPRRRAYLALLEG